VTCRAPGSDPTKGGGRVATTRSPPAGNDREDTGTQQLQPTS
jgi:hypothetical protein